MTRMLLAAAGSIAVIALSASGAQAQEWSGHHRSGGFSGRDALDCTAIARSGTDIRFGDGNADRGDRRRVSRACNSDVLMDWYGGEWARWNNRSWEPTSYNDWWHEEPSRAYPAWMRHNQDCARRWYAGDTLSC